MRNAISPFAEFDIILVGQALDNRRRDEQSYRHQRLHIRVQQTDRRFHGTTPHHYRHYPSLSVFGFGCQLCLSSSLTTICVVVDVAVAGVRSHHTLGVSTFAGLGAMFIFFPLNAIFGRLTNLRRAIKYKIQDSRLKMMNELLNGIRVSVSFSFLLN